MKNMLLTYSTYYNNSIKQLKALRLMKMAEKFNKPIINSRYDIGIVVRNCTYEI